MENVGHFMEELKSLPGSMETEFNSTAKLLDHASLYYYVLNQIERAAVYRELMNEQLSKVKEEEMYKPQFPLPRSPEEKEVRMTRKGSFECSINKKLQCSEQEW